MQIVKDATHSFGSLLDDVYFWNLVLKQLTFFASVQRLYFSDNDAVRIKVLKNDVDFAVQDYWFEKQSETAAYNPSLECNF